MLYPCSIYILKRFIKTYIMNYLTVKMLLLVYKIYWVLILVLETRILAETINTNYSSDALRKKYPDYGTRWIYFPNENEIPTVGYLQMPSDDFFSIFNPSSQDIERALNFRLYTRILKTGRVLSLNNTEDIKNNFDTNKKTKLIIHGWLSNGNSDTCIYIKDAYLYKQDVNVIIVDWSDIANNIFYPIPMAHTKDVGYFYGRFLNYLIQIGAKPCDIHLIGHSLGAHISGFAGRFVSSGKIKRITGLDPALPGFHGFNVDRLLSSDADFVDVIHTSGGVLGFFDNLGHADFFPNGGVPPQPGCFGPAEIVEACSHGRSWKYFAESIINQQEFVAHKCKSWNDFLGNTCKNNPTIAFMGEPVSLDATGSYYLRTESSPPYAQTSTILSYMENNDLSN